MTHAQLASEALQSAQASILRARIRHHLKPRATATLANRHFAAAVEALKGAGEDRR